MCASYLLRCPVRQSQAAAATSATETAEADAAYQRRLKQEVNAAKRLVIRNSEFHPHQAAGW